MIKFRKYYTKKYNDKVNYENNKNNNIIITINTISHNWLYTYLQKI